MTNHLKRVAVRIDWPQFFLTTFVSVLLGYWISRILNTAEGKEQ